MTTFTDLIVPSNPLTGDSDPEDAAAIRLGEDLWTSNGPALTLDEFSESLVQYAARVNGIPIDPLSRLEMEVVP